MFQSVITATKIAVARAPKFNFSFRGISNYSGLKNFGFSAPLKNPAQRSSLFNNSQSISLQTPLQLTPIYTSLRLFAAKTSVRSKPAKSGKSGAVKKQTQKQKEQRQRERAKVLKEKEKAKQLAERQKAAAQKEKERERLQKEKEKEKQRREKEKEKQRLAKEKEKQNESKKKDENKPVRSRTAYTLFFSAEYPKLKNQHPNKTLTEIVKVASQKWNNLSANEKKPFQDEANKDRVRYQKEMDAYKKTLPPKRPLSSYILFSNDVRDAIKKENPESSISDLAKIIGEKWKSISNAEREKYNKQAEKLKADYKKKLEKHQANQ